MGRQSSEAHVLEVCLNNLVVKLDLEVCALSANTLPRASPNPVGESDQAHLND